MPTRRTFRVVVAAAAFAATLVPAPHAKAALAARRVAGGLAFPAAFTFSPGGRIFYGERLTGRIRIFNPARDTDAVFFTVPDLATDVEQGLLGVALHPNYPSTPFVYAYATRTVGDQTRNHILRITNSGGSGTAMEVLFTTGAGRTHNGGRILFGPDGALYAVVGENGPTRNAQDLSANLGKVLRLNPDGSVPTDNPFPGSAVFAYGIRNSFGLDFDPETGRLWETENGPSCNDELNRIRRGRNFGWGPHWTCETPPEPPRNTNQDGPSPVLPLRYYTPPIAPTGAAFCASCGLGPGTEGGLFFGAFNTRDIRKVTLDATRTSVASQTVVLTHTAGVLSMEAAPDGALHFSDRSGIYRLVST